MPPLDGTEIVIASEAWRSRGHGTALRSLDRRVAALLAMTIPSKRVVLESFLHFAGIVGVCDRASWRQRLNGREGPRSGARESGATAHDLLARVRPDMRIAVADDFETLANRLEAMLAIMREIAKIAGKKGWWLPVNESHCSVFARSMSSI